MTDTEPPTTAWTRHPVKAAQSRQTWPDHAEAFTHDDLTELAYQGTWRADDPRPWSGYVLQARFCDAYPACEHVVHRRYECVRCGLGSSLGTDHGLHRYQQIKLGCPACRRQCLHNPAGAVGRLLRLHEHEHEDEDDHDD